MKPLNVCFGNISKCCCCSLATGTIIWTIVLGLAALINLILSPKVANILSTVVNILRVILLIYALVKYNWIVLLIVASLTALGIILETVSVFAFQLPIILELEDPTRQQQLLGLFIGVIIILVISFYFISILVSLANVYMVGGTGWEGKNWKQIEEENDNKNRDNENTRRNAEEEIEISH